MNHARTLIKKNRFIIGTLQIDIKSKFTEQYQRFFYKIKIAKLESGLYIKIEIKIKNLLFFQFYFTRTAVT